MNYEEALERFEEFGNYCDDYCDGECKKCSDMKDRILKALEKQIPKKPINKVRGEMMLPQDECVECGTFLFISDRYCPYCGQAIDWSEVE